MNEYYKLNPLKPSVPFWDSKVVINVVSTIGFIIALFCFIFCLVFMKEGCKFISANLGKQNVRGSFKG